MQLIKEAKSNSANYSQHNRSLKKKLKAQKARLLDDQLHSLHEEVFQEIDCLDCANCCKTTSPIFTVADIGRIAKVLKMKEQEFIETYLRLDEENDFVLQSAPCAFLGHDNKCIIYQDRPKACREYPHTNRKKMQQIISLTLKNAEICPAVYHILERWKRIGQ